MKRACYTLLAILISAWIKAQDGVDTNIDPEAAWYEAPTLWIVLAVGLVVGLLFLRKQTRGPGRT